MEKEGNKIAEEIEGENEEVENILMSNENSNALLSIFSRLYMINFNDKISLPKIAVLGDQSTGKSSVVESLSGINLPRGSGIVTRVPIVVSMVNKPEKSIVFEGEKVTNSQLCEKILERQNELAGSEKGVSDKPINIQIASPAVCDLTIIDLPGLVINPVEGQPDDIKQQVDKLVTKYIKDEGCIVLSVLPATQDIATIRSISFSQKFDLEGDRTLGVLTKTDVSQEKSSVTDVLDQKRIRFKLGIFAVRNRTPSELKKNVSLSDARTLEDEFFRKEYPDYLENCGMRSLATEMSNLLKTRIMKCYPSLHKEMERKLRTAERKLASLGPGIPLEGFEKRILLLDLFRDITKAVEEGPSIGHSNLEILNEEEIEGEEEEEKKVKVTNISMETNGNYEVRKIDEMMKMYGEIVRKSIPKYHSDEWKKKIEEEIKRCRAGILEGFLPFAVFKNFMMKQINKVQYPAEELYNKTRQLLEKFVRNVVKEKISEEYEGLRTKIIVEVSRYFKRVDEEGKKLMIMEFKKEERIFTNNHYYGETWKKLREEDFQNSIKGKEENVVVNRGGIKKTKQFIPTSVVKLVRSNAEQEVVSMLIMLKSYHKVSAKRIMDNVPLSIWLNLVERIKTEIYKLLITLAVNDDFLASFKETPTTARKRRLLKQEIVKYKKGLSILNEVMF